MSKKISNITDLIESNYLSFLYNNINYPVSFIAYSGEIKYQNSSFSKLSEKKKKQIVTICQNQKTNFSCTNLQTFSNEILSSKLVDPNKNVLFFIQIPKIAPPRRDKKLNEVAHDFNNLFTTMNNSLELLKSKVEFKSDSAYLIDNIGKSIYRASEINNEIIAKQKYLKKETNVYLLIREIYDTLNQSIPHHIKISYLHRDTNINVICNPNDIYRVIMNLSINAIEAISEKGEIEIVLDYFPIKEKYVAKYNLPKGAYCRIKVKDNGSGIEPDILNKIFERHYSTKAKKRESGLGLNIVKKIITDHKGSISVKSKLGKGTEFEILLPAMNKTIPEKRKGPEKTILVAEDDDMLRELLKELLESYGYKIIEAQNGKEVLNIAGKSNIIDLLIIDRKMPLVDGLECIETLRKDLGVSVPIILASGSPSISDLNLKHLNINNIINKPYNFTNMLNVINAILT